MNRSNSTSNYSIIDQGNNNYNKTNINSSNISKASTMLNQSESYLLSTLRQNNRTINFQKKNKKLKNKFFQAILNNKDKYSFINLFLEKKHKNSDKLNLIKLNPSKKSNLLIKNRSEMNIKYQSPLSQKIQDEILDEKHKYLSNFIKKIESIILLKKFLYEQKKIYEKQIEYNKDNKILLKKINKKISSLKYILKENENILEINKYIKFLIEKRIEMKYYNLFLSTKIDYIKDDNKELLINIKEKSEYLWKLFDIRNLLICVKEKMLIRDLPLIFHFYNTSYLSIIIKKYNNYIDLLETQKKYVLNNPLINLKIPTNLVEYIYLNRKKEIQKEKVDKKFLKYLDPKFPIFENADEFIKTFSAIEERTVDYFLYFYVSEKYRNDNFKRNINKNKGFIKCEVKYLKEIIEECETILFNLKERNKNLNNYLFLIKKEYDYKYKKELENDKEKELKKQKINKLFLRSINNTTSLEKINFISF